MDTVKKKAAVGEVLDNQLYCDLVMHWDDRNSVDFDYARVITKQPL